VRSLALSARAMHSSTLLRRRLRWRRLATVARAEAYLELQRRRFREEVASAVTHGAGLLLAVGEVPVLIALGVLYGSGVHVAAFSIYGASLVALYAASTLYHAFQTPRLKRLFRVVDHAAIYLLIAGTYTPVTLVSLDGLWGWGLFALVWTLAAVGCVFKLFCTGRFERTSTALYLGMGWAAVLAIGPLLDTLPAAAFGWLLAGGLAYSAGVAFYAWERLPYNHAVWHGFVLAGSVCHFVAIAGYVW
jgi:hemolysin III